MFTQLTSSNPVEKPKSTLESLTLFPEIFQKTDYDAKIEQEVVKFSLEAQNTARENIYGMFKVIIIEHFFETANQYPITAKPPVPIDFAQIKNWYLDPTEGQKRLLLLTQKLTITFKRINTITDTAENQAVPLSTAAAV